MCSKANRPFTADDWLNNFKDAVLFISSEDDINKVIKLFKKAEEHYRNINMALKFTSLVKLGYCTGTQAEKIWDLLIPGYCYDLNRSHEIWNAYRTDIKRREPNSQKIFETYKNQLKFPSQTLDVTYDEFQKFCAEHANDLPDYDRNLLRTEFQEMMNTSLAFKSFELQIKQVEENLKKVLDDVNQRLSEDQKKECRRVLFNMAIGQFCKFIKQYTENQIFPQEEIPMICERMIRAFPFQVEPWHECLNYLFGLMESDANSLHAYSEMTMNVIARGMRQSPKVQRRVQDLILTALIDFTMTPEVKFCNILENSKTQACTSSKALVKNIFIAHLKHLKQIRNEESFRDNFIVSLDWLFRLFGKKEGPEEYLDVMAKLTGEKILEPKSIQYFHDELITEFPLHESPWKCYLDFLFKQIAHGETSQISCNSVSDVICRGMQQHNPSIQQAIGSSILKALQKCNLTDLSEFQNILNNVGTFANSEDYVANIIVAYLSHLPNRTENNFNMSWRVYCAIFNKSEEDVNERKELCKTKIRSLQAKRQATDDNEMSISKKFKQNCGIDDDEGGTM